MHEKLIIGEVGDWITVLVGREAVFGKTVDGEKKERRDEKQKKLKIQVGKVKKVDEYEKKNDQIEETKEEKIFDKQLFKN